MIYEIMNPGDEMTVEADDPVVAGVAMLYLGEGKIGLTSESGETVFPLLAFGGDAALDSWLAQVGIGSVDNLKEWAFERKDEIACCLESIVYGSFSDRKGILAVVDGKDNVEVLQAMAAWNNAQRSSISDYSSFAFTLAKRVRELELDSDEEDAKAE